jgi:uncharacterized membrane protein YkoI
MNAKTIIATLAAAVLATGLATNAVAAEKPGKADRKAAQQAKLEAKAKVSRADAEKIALAKVPGGTVKECELEKEKGKLIWSFDIETPGSQDLTEVQVDAKTGKVIAVEKETPADQKKEKKEKGDKE